MRPKYYLVKSDKRNKKYMVKTPKNKIIYFGQAEASDYTIHKNEVRKNAYLLRHYKNENWDDLNSAGAWSRYILWNETTIKKSISNMEKLFKIKIIT